MPEIVIELLKYGGATGILSLFLYLAFKELKEVLNSNQKFLEKQTDTISEITDKYNKTTDKYNESMLKVVRDYEKHSSETNEAMGRLVEKIDNIAKDIPDIKNTNFILKEHLRKTENLIEEIRGK